MFWVSTSWGHSSSPTRTFTFYYSLIMFQDRWRLGPIKLMMLKLWFGVPKVLINDQGSYFCNRAMAMLLKKYEVVHQVTTAYHPQTND
ncbi:hypothetical protein CR513_38497, partial [Mucuna pruriens]